MAIVYVLSNPAFDRYVKVGRTVDLEQRLRQLDNTSVPLPFRCEFAVEVADEHGNQRKVEVAKRVKRWLMASSDGKVNLVVRYGSKPLEFAKGKNAIELASEAEVADTLRKVRDAVELGELDAVIEQQARFGRRLTPKSK